MKDLLSADGGSFLYETFQLLQNSGIPISSLYTKMTVV